MGPPSTQRKPNQCAHTDQPDAGMHVLSLSPSLSLSPPLSRALSKRVRLWVQKCLDRTDPVPWPQIQERIEQELGKPLSTVFSHIDHMPLATASVAQVHTVCLSTVQYPTSQYRPNPPAPMELCAGVCPAQPDMSGAGTAVGS